MNLSTPSKRSACSPLVSVWLSGLILLLGSTAAQGATSEFRILMNIDVNPTTGCDVTTADGVFPGVEQMLVTTVETGTSTGQVTLVERRECVDEATDTFGPLIPVSAGGWPVGVGLGLDGSDVIETFVALADVGGDNPPPVIRLGVVGDDGTAEDALLVVRPAGTRPILLNLATLLEIPTLSEWGLILLTLLLATLALWRMRRMQRRSTVALLLLVSMAVTVVAWASVRDGLIDDWLGVSPLAEDPEADAPPGADLRALFAQESAGEICFRIDAFLEFNGPPNAVDDMFTVAEDSTGNSLDVLANDSDPETDPLTITAVGTPDQGGTATTDGSTVTYTPAADFEGTETFTYTIDDGNGNTDTATVTVTVTNVNDPPDAVDDMFTVAEDSTGNSLDVLANDTDAPDMGETLTITGVGTPDQGGTATTDGSTVTYSPAADFAGVETFTYTIDDGNGGMDTATVTVTVTDANDPPDAVDDMFTVDEDSTNNSLDVLANDTDAPDTGETLTITGVGATDQGGTATTDGSTVTYTPAANFTGVETFTYTIDDGNGGMDTATVTVTIANTNEDPPVCAADMATTDEDNSTLVDVLANDTDPDPMDTLTVLSVNTTGTSGSVTNNTNNVTYDPNGAFESLDDGEMDTDTFSYTARDSTGLTCMATVTVTITGVNDAPMVVGEIFDVAAGNFAPAIGNTTLQFANSDAVSTPDVFVAGDVLDNDSDPDVEALAITAFDAASTAGGTVSMNLATGEFTYLPPVGFEGMDSFTYTVSDGTVAAMGTVTIEVADMVWYLDNDPANDGSGDDGRSTSGFDSIAQFEAENGNGAADDPEAGDIIFIFQGTTTYDAGGGDTDGLDLLDQQKLLGEGVDLVVQGLTLVSGNAANQPSIDNTNASGDAVTVLATTGNRTGIEIRGLSIDGTDNAVEVTSANTFQVGVTISDNTIAGSGAEGLHFNPGSSGAFVTTVENNVFSTASAAGNAIDLTTAAASGDVEVALNANTNVTSSGGHGILLDNSAGGGDLFITGFAGNTVHGNTTGDGIRILNATFDADPTTPTNDFTGDEVSGGNTTVGVGNPVGGSALVLTNVEGDLAFGTLNLSTDGMGSVGLDATGTGTLNAGAGTGFEITSTGGTISSTNGPAVVLDPLTAGLTFSSVSSSNSPTVGVSLVDVAGTFSATGGSITGATGTSFNVNGGAPGVTYNGTITHASNGTRTIEIQGMAGGSASFGGAVSATDGTGIRIANNTGTNPVGFTSTVDLGTSGNRISDSTAFTMSGNSAGTTVTVSDLDVFTSGQTAVNASGSGTLDADELSINTVSNGRALDLDGIRSLVDVDSVTCSHNSNCVDLTSLAATSNTTFAGVGLTCTGGTCFNANSAQTVEVTGTGNTISATNAVGLNLTSTTIGAGDATFQSISASGAANGIVLNSTGTTGDFVVTGDNSGTRNATGGTLQNTTSHAVLLSSARNVSLSSLDILSAGADAVNAASGVGDLTLSGVSINSPVGNGLFARNLLGTNRINSDSLVTGVDTSNTSAVDVLNTNTNLTLLEIEDSTFNNSASGQSTVFFQSAGSSEMTLRVVGSTFTGLFAQAITAAAGQTAGSTGTMHTEIGGAALGDGNTFEDASTAGNGGENNVACTVANGAVQRCLIQANIFDNIARDGSIANTSVVRTQNSGGTWIGEVRQNKIRNINIQFGGGRHGIGHVNEPPSGSPTSPTSLIIADNDIDDLPTREAIFVDFRCLAGNGDLTISGNDIGQNVDGLGAFGAIGGTQQGIEIRSRSQAGVSCTALSRTLNVLVSGNVADVNTSSRMVDVDSEDATTLNITFGTNDFDNAGSGDEIDVDAEDAGSTLCADIAGNTLDGGSGTIEVDEAGTLNVVQKAATGAADAAEIDDANGIPAANVTVVGTPQFNAVASCAQPSHPAL